MRSKYVLDIVLAGIIVSLVVFAVFLEQRTRGSRTSDAITPINSVREVQNGSMKSVEARVDGSAPIIKTPEVYEGSTLLDGPSLVDSKCASCHKPEVLAQIKKPRLGWEKTLAQMEAMGVHLDNIEKIVLLDYLAYSDQP